MISVAVSGYSGSFKCDHCHKALAGEHVSINGIEILVPYREGEEPRPANIVVNLHPRCARQLSKEIDRRAPKGGK